MTEQRNTELIAAARSLIDQYDPAFAFVLKQVTDRLEAADQRAAEYAAVVEKVRGILSHQNRLDEYGVEPLRWAVRKANGILATAPADALREHDAALIEELADEWHADNAGTMPRAYRWLCEKARQRREEQ